MNAMNEHVRSELPVGSWLDARAAAATKGDLPPAFLTRVRGIR